MCEAHGRHGHDDVGRPRRRSRRYRRTQDRARSSTGDQADRNSRWTRRRGSSQPLSFARSRRFRTSGWWKSRTPPSSVLRDLARRFGIPHACAGLSEMADLGPEVVHILTPPDSHARLAIEALNMGCHVFVEKPMAPTVAECDAMIAASVRANRALSVNHSARHNPVVVPALDTHSKWRLRRRSRDRLHRSSDYPPYAGSELPAAFRHGGYPFQDLGVHALSLMEAFLGPIRHVDARYESTDGSPMCSSINGSER